MKHIAIGVIWTYMLLWAANYLAIYASIPAILTGSVAVLIGIGYTFERMRRSTRVQRRPAGLTEQPGPTSRGLEQA